MSAIWGRDAELTEASAALERGAAEPFALIIEGDDGSGRTTVWKAVLDDARRRGFRVLTARPAGSEATFAFAAVADLLREDLDDALAELPSPQRSALETALLRADAEAAPDPGAVAFALFASLASLAQARPTIVAIDDPEWLDGASARVLAFAFRRLEGMPLGVVVTSRTQVDDEAVLPSIVSGDGALAERTTRIALRPLDLDATRQLIAARISARLARWMLVEIQEASGGNPLLALELARALERHGVDVEPGHPLPVPRRLADLISDRLAELPDDVRWMLLLVAASARPTAGTVAAAIGDRAAFERSLRVAVEADLFERTDEELRFSNPLTAAVVIARALPESRRHAHRVLADVVADPEERARHLAHAAAGPDEELAALLEATAEGARRRGAPDSAAQLAELALLATHEDATEACTRRSALAGRYAFESGQVERAEELLQRAVPASSGRTRAEVLLFLARVRYHRRDAAAAAELVEQALEVADDDPALQAGIHLELAAASELAGDHAGATEHARRAVELAARSDDRSIAVEATSLQAFYEFLSGGGFPSEGLERANALRRDDTLVRPLRSPSFHEALMRRYADDVDGARALLTTLVRSAREEGDESSLSVLLSLLAEVETWSGRLDLAGALADEAKRVADWTGQRVYLVLALYAQALVAATRGDLDRGEELARESLVVAEMTGAHQPGEFGRTVLGFVGLSRGDPADAHRWLSPLTERWRADVSVEPASVRFVPDDVEALVAIGELEEAERLLAPYEATAAALERAWAIGAAARCRGMISAARRDVDDAVEAFDRALSTSEKVGQPLETGRAHLAKGMALRRAKRWAAARESLTRAADVFDEASMRAWGARARAELARIGGRSPYLAQLTETEERVAQLVTTGLSNKEVAARLFVTVSTVESNLRRAYRKLGVRSRTELAHRLSSTSD